MNRAAAFALGLSLATILGTLASPSSTLACAVCYGAAEGPFIRGLHFSVLALLGVTYVVITGLLACFLVLRRRVRLTANTSEGAY